MKVLFKESIVSIKKNFKRFLSILLIVLLGVGFFTGIKVTSPDMKKTMASYYNETNFMDFNLISTWGIKENEINVLKDNGYTVEPSYEFDSIVKFESEEVVKIISYDEDSTVNKIILLDGALPNNPNECLIEESEHTESFKIGDEITIEDDILKEKKLTIVGIIKSPLYTSLERGATTLLSGNISFFMYVPIENFDIDYYTNMYIKLDLENRDIFSDYYSNILEKEKEKIEKLTNSLIDERYNNEKNNAVSEIKQQEEKLQKEKKKFTEEITKAYNKLKTSKEEYNLSIKQLNLQVEKKETEFKYAADKINKSKEELEQNKKILISQEQELNENKKILENLNNDYEALNNNFLSIEKNIDELVLQRKKIEILISQGIEVEKNTLKLDKLIKEKSSLEIKKSQIEEQIDKLSVNINGLQKEIDNADNIIKNSKYQIKEAERKLFNSKKELNDNYDLFKINVSSSKKQLNNAYKIIKTSEEKLNHQKQESEEKFIEAEKSINKAKEEIKKLEKPEWYILNHDSNMGFYQYNQDTQRIEKIGEVFPLVFFVVAILICLNSMTRMVEEERNQLGTLKALGYNNLQIISKYIIYVLLATVIGSILGVLIGMKIIPKIIINMYAVLYNIGNPILNLDIKYALMGTILAIICILGATLFACYKELSINPASLMRPKSPKAGKRVFLERIKFVWNSLSFSKKVTVRNVFRYKKRFLMTIIGISGCTGLIIAGFGLRDCITSMVPMQYGKIFDYQIEVTYKDNISLNEKEKETERIKQINKINSIVRIKKESITIENKETNQSVQLIVPLDELKDFIKLKDRITNDEYKLINNGIVTEKLAKLLELKKGEQLIIKSDKKYSFKVGDITENYFGHFIYLDKSIYNSNNYNTLLIKTDNLTKEEQINLAQELRKNNLIASITYTSSMTNIFDKTMENFGLVAVVLIVSAGLLAFVVLYNLASVNISERKRELATIKVLGFFDREVYNYIGRETTILTVIGMLLGVLMGKVLTIYILKTCELDSVMFGTSITLYSYIYSLLITLVFTILVNITTYFSLKKIDMIESLKSVE